MKDGLEKLKDRLYKKGEFFPERKRKTVWGWIKREEGKPPTSWEYSYESLSGAPPSSSMKKILIIAVVVLLISAAIFAFFLLRGYNIISSSNINIDVKGLSRVDSGKIVNLDVAIENKNESLLELATLLVEFPSGFFSEDGNELTRERYSLGEIGAKSSINKPIDFILFGEEDEEKNIKFTLEYRLEGSNAIFAKEMDYTVKIARPAVGVSVSMPKEINARQEMKLEISLVSNSDSIIKGLVVKVDYPSGFQFSKADPKPQTKNNTWSLGDLGPTQQRKINIYGAIEGQDLEEKAFRVETGAINKAGVFVLYGSNIEKVSLKKPFLDLTLFLGGENDENNTAFSGEGVRAEIVWKNNLSANATDVVIEAKIKGRALDEKSISVSNGTYRTFDKTLVWNSSTVPELKLIESGGSGKVNFSFKIISPLPIVSADDKNFVIDLECSIKGKTASEILGETEISSNVSKQVKISSFLQLASKILHYTGDFQNTGPMPPQVGKETTYTVVWSFGNTSNDFSDVKARALLPSYVRWLAKISPSNENISYNNETGEVVWSISKLQAGAGILWPVKQISFQISFAPSLNQIGTSPVLVSDTAFEGKDVFTGNIIEETKSNLNTILNNDPQFKSDEGKVIE